MERNTSGPGNNSLYKDVEVRRVGAEEPVRIVTLDEGQGASRVKLRWKSQSRLEVSYEGAPLLLQVVRVGELTIATTDVSRE